MRTHQKAAEHELWDTLTQIGHARANTCRCVRSARRRVGICTSGSMHTDGASSFRLPLRCVACSTRRRRVVGLVGVETAPRACRLSGSRVPIAACRFAAGRLLLSVAASPASRRAARHDALVAAVPSSAWLVKGRRVAVQKPGASRSRGTRDLRGSPEPDTWQGGIYFDMPQTIMHALTPQSVEFLFSFGDPTPVAR